MTDTRLLAATDVAEQIGVTVQTLATWRTRGAGPPYIKLGRMVRYRPEDIAAWVESQVRAGPEASGD